MCRDDTARRNICSDIHKRKFIVEGEPAAVKENRNKLCGQQINTEYHLRANTDAGWGHEEVFVYLKDGHETYGKDWKSMMEDGEYIPESIKKMGSRRWGELE